MMCMCGGCGETNQNEAPVTVVLAPLLPPELTSISPTLIIMLLHTLITLAALVLTHSSVPLFLLLLFLLCAVGHACRTIVILFLVECPSAYGARCVVYEIHPHTDRINRPLGQCSMVTMNAGMNGNQEGKAHTKLVWNDQCTGEYCSVRVCAHD